MITQHVLIMYVNPQNLQRTFRKCSMLFMSATSYAILSMLCVCTDSS